MLSKSLLKIINSYKVLSTSEQITLLKNYKEDGCIPSREALVNSNLRFVNNIAMTFLSYYRKYSEDLFSEGVLGLIRAIEDFDLSKKNAFSTYSVWWIRRYMQDWIYQLAHTTQIPSAFVFKKNQIQKSEECGEETPIFPTFENLDRPLQQETYESIEDTLNNALVRSLIDDMIQELPEFQADLIKSYYGLDGYEFTIEEFYSSRGRKASRQAGSDLMRKAMNVIRESRITGKLTTELIDA